MYFYYMDISERIKLLRKTRGFTQVDLAKKLGTTQKAISDYEKGSAKPSRERLPKLAAIFGVSVDELLGTEPQKADIDNEPTTERVHGNSRQSKLQSMFKQLNADDQRAVLKHIAGLIAHAKDNNGGSRR